MKTAHILLVEDNRGDIVVVKLSLKRHGIQHALHVVNDGDQALRFIERMGLSEDAPFPNLLLLDLNLPRVDGREVLRAFRSRADCARIPVIVFTSSDAPSDREEVAALGIEYYFKKPTDFEAFMEIGAVIGRYLAENTDSAEACAP